MQIGLCQRSGTCGYGPFPMQGGGCLLYRFHPFVAAIGVITNQNRLQVTGTLKALFIFLAA